MTVLWLSSPAVASKRERKRKRKLKAEADNWENDDKLIHSNGEQKTPYNRHIHDHGKEVERVNTWNIW